MLQVERLEDRCVPEITKPSLMPLLGGPVGGVATQNQVVIQYQPPSSSWIVPTLPSVTWAPPPTPPIPQLHLNLPPDYPMPPVDPAP